MKHKFYALLSVIFILVGTWSISQASTTTKQVSFNANINQKSLIFDANELPDNATITSATLYLTGNDTTNGVELFEIRVLANGQIAGHLSSDDWFNDAENSIELDASNLNIVNSQIQLQIASSLEGSEILPSTASLLVNYEQGSSTKAKTTRADNTKTPVPDTGQTKCYDYNSKEIPCPKEGEPFYGQDANYTRNPMSFVKLDDNGVVLPDNATSWIMVRDNVTGLIWEMKTDDSTIHDKDNTYTWYDSNAATNGGNAGTAGTGTDTEDFIKSLNDAKYGGYSDWRLPTVEELASIVDNGVYGPAIKTKYFVNTQPSNYWTSTTYSYDINNAWQVDFYYGYDDDSTKSKALYALAVRGGATVAATLVENQNGTVTDTATGLMWQKVTAGSMSWQGAIDYCEMLDLAGYQDWRLPTLKELRTLVNYNTPYHAPTIDTDIFFDTLSSFYWSNTTHTYYVENAWGVAFNNGHDYNNSKNSDRYVRAVRNGYTGLYDNLTISVLPATCNVSKDAGTTTFDVANTGTGTMTWIAEVTDGGTWLKITSGASGTNSGTIVCSVTANTSISKSRTGIIKVTAVNGTEGSPVEITVTQLPVIKPTGTTEAADTISSNSAFLNGRLNPNGTNTTWYFQYGATTSYGKNTISANAGSGTTNIPVRFEITEFTPSTIYHYRLTATNSAGTIYGDDQVFKTLGTIDFPPTISTNNATEITKTSATLNGTVIPNGISTTYYFEYGTTTSYGNKIVPLDGDTTTDNKDVEANITGLKADTVYHFRLTAKNSNGTVNGTDQIFITTPSISVSPPTITTGVVGSITPTFATLNGTINPNNGETTYSFEYGTTDSYGNVTPMGNAGAGGTKKSVSANLTGLKPSTLYHYRLVAQNSAGKTNDTDKTFTTTANGTAPKLTLSSASGASDVSGESGKSVTLNLVLANVSGTSISAISTDINFDTTLLDTPTAVIGAAATAAGIDTITFDMVGSNSKTVRIALFSMSDNKPIGDGVVAFITFTIKSTATNGKTSLTQKAIGSDLDGQDVAIEGVEGTITINNCKLGDCNCDGIITIGEVQSAISMYLGKKTVATCCDSNGDGKVSIAEVQTIINNFKAIVVASSSHSKRDATKPAHINIDKVNGAVNDGGDYSLNLISNKNSLSAISIDVKYPVELTGKIRFKLGTAAKFAGKELVQNEIKQGLTRIALISELGNQIFDNQIFDNQIIGDGEILSVHVDGSEDENFDLNVDFTITASDEAGEEVTIIPSALIN